MSLRAPGLPVSVAVVEDDEPVLDAIRLVLESRGWNIETYTTGEAFLADVHNHNLDCVLIDPHLPQMSGAEVARRLVESTQIPFIGLTARPASPITAAIARIGAHTILTKPVAAETLVENVEAAIGSTVNKYR